jgi:hypothetical protein
LYKKVKQLSFLMPEGVPKRVLGSIELDKREESR